MIGCKHFFGTDFIEKGITLTLEKEPDNEADNEAIAVKYPGVGKCGYVANSPYTVVGETFSAGRLYDKIGDTAEAEIMFAVPGGAICRVVLEEDEEDNDEQEDEEL